MAGEDGRMGRKGIEVTESGPKAFHLAHPPLVESVLGLQFEPLERLQVPHIGLYWQSIRQDYPKFSLHPPLPEHREEFEPRSLSSGPDASLQIALVEAPHIPRCWFVSADEARVIQVQKNRFLRNWRRANSETEYPHFSALSGEFRIAWSDFSQFLAAEDIDRPEINQAEVTYINHVERNRPGGSSLLQASDLLRFSERVDPIQSTVTANVANLTATFSFPREAVRVHLSCKSAFRKSDGAEVYLLEITARGRPASSEADAGHAWLVNAHERVVDVFQHSIRPELLKTWGA